MKNKNIKLFFSQIANFKLVDKSKEKLVIKFTRNMVHAELLLQQVIRYSKVTDNF